MSPFVSRPRLQGAKRVAVFTLAVLLSMVMSAGFASAVPVYDYAVPLDAYEADNTQATAKPIVVGAAPQMRTMHTALNSDWVKFPAKAGATYVIENPDFMSIAAASPAYVELSGMRPVLELVNGSGVVLARSQGWNYRKYTAKNSFFLNERITWKAQSTETLYLRVTSFPDSELQQVGSYLLQVRSVVPQITGTVTTPDGLPAEGAYVSAYPTGFDTSSAFAGLSMWTGAETVTDQNGNYVIYGLADGDYEVRFDGVWWNGGYTQDETYNNVHGDDAAQLTPVTVGGMMQTSGINAQLDEGPGFISGRIVDENGDGVANIRVMPYYWNYSYWAQGYDYAAMTDEDGYYVCRNGFDAEWRLGFYDYSDANQYPTEYWNDTVSFDSADTILVSGGSAVGSYDATLVANPTLATGVVEDEAGDPIANVEVRVYDAAGDQLTNTYTNEDGTWALHTTEVWAEAKFMFVDDNSSFVSEWYNDKADVSTATTVTLDAENPPALSTVLALHKPSLSGVVTDARTGAKVAGEQVWLYERTSSGLFPIDLAITDAMGAYTFQQVRGREVIVKFYDKSGFYVTEYSGNVASAFRAEPVYPGIGTDLKVDAALQAQGDRVYGATRFSTAVAAAQQAFPEWQGVHEVIIASGDDAAAADPLAAASLCWAYNGPLLLTRANSTPAETLAAIRAIETASGNDLKIRVVGGPGSIPAARLAEMARIVGAEDVERLPYGNRYETARQVALRVHQVALDRGEDPETAFVVNGSDTRKFFDALSASTISAQTGAPILLTPTVGAVPASTRLALQEIGAENVYVVGGTGSVPASAYTAVGADRRLSGRDRYETSVNLAKFGGAQGWLSFTQIGLAAAMPDGATGGAAMGLLGGPLLITRPDYLPAVTYKFIDDNDQFIERAMVFGGSGSVSGNIGLSVKRALKQ